MPDIDIDQSKVSNYSSNISSSANNIQLQTLSAIDSISTIAGNEISQNAFIEAQNALSELLAAIRTEANKIQTLGDEFKSVDEQLSSMIHS